MIVSENNLQKNDCPDRRETIYPQYVKNSREAHVWLALCMSLLLFKLIESTKYFPLAQSQMREV